MRPALVDMLIQRTLLDMRHNNETTPPHFMDEFDLKSYIEDAAEYLHITDLDTLESAYRELS